MKKELQDRVWSVLPKEFREEVKKEWQSANNKERLTHDAFLRGEHAMLVSIFGLNNLNREEKPAEPKFKMLPYHVWNENELEVYIDPDASHKQPEDENHPGDTSHGNRNISQDTANCDISRLQIAAMAMQGLLNATFGKFDPKIKPEAIAIVAVEYADALIREEKGDNHAD